MIPGNPIVKPSLKVAARVIGEQAYLLDPSVGQLERLNPVGSYVWQLVEKQEHNLEDICSAVVNEFDVTEDVARKDLHEFLMTLGKRGLVDFIH